MSFPSLSRDLKVSMINIPRVTSSLRVPSIGARGNSILRMNRFTWPGVEFDSHKHKGEMWSL